MDLDNLHWGWRVASMLVAVPTTMLFAYLLGSAVGVAIEKVYLSISNRF